MLFTNKYEDNRAQFDDDDDDDSRDQQREAKRATKATGTRPPLRKARVMLKRAMRQLGNDVKQGIAQKFDRDKTRAAVKNSEVFRANAGGKEMVDIVADTVQTEATNAHGKISATIDAVEEVWTVLRSVVRSNAIQADAIEFVQNALDVQGNLPDSDAAAAGKYWINGRMWDLTVPLTSVLVAHTAVITNELGADAALLDRVTGPAAPSEFHFPAGRIAVSAVSVAGQVPTLSGTVQTVFDPTKHTHMLVVKAGAGTISDAQWVPLATLFPSLVKGNAFPASMPTGYLNPEGFGAIVMSGGSNVANVVLADALASTFGARLAFVSRQRISHDIAGVLTTFVTTGVAAATELIGKLPLLLPDVAAGLLKRPGSTLVTK